MKVYLDESQLRVEPLAQVEKTLAGQRFQMDARANFLRACANGEKKMDPVMAWHLGVGKRAI